MVVCSQTTQYYRLIIINLEITCLRIKRPHKVLKIAGAKTHGETLSEGKWEKRNNEFGILGEPRILQKREVDVDNE